MQAEMLGVAGGKVTKKQYSLLICKRKLQEWYSAALCMLIIYCQRQAGVIPLILCVFHRQCLLSPPYCDYCGLVFIRSWSRSPLLPEPLFVSTDRHPQTCNTLHRHRGTLWQCSESDETGQLFLLFLWFFCHRITWVSCCSWWNQMGGFSFKFIKIIFNGLATLSRK